MSLKEFIVQKGIVAGNTLTIDSSGNWVGNTITIAKGGTGAVSAGDARTNLNIDVAGTDNSTDMTVSGTPDYITRSGQDLIRAQVDLTADVTGDLPVTEGGTGSSSAAAARTALDMDAIGVDNSTDMTVSGTPDYITRSGQDLARGSIVLTTDVTGDLPVTEGGTGSSSAAAARTALDMDAIGVDNSTDVSLAGTPDYITISGQVITRGNVVLTTDVSGVLPDTLGGTGHTSPTANRVAVTNATGITASTTITTTELGLLNGKTGGLVESSRGSWTPTWTGFSTAPTGDFEWIKFTDGTDEWVMVHDDTGAQRTGTSNATTMTITGIPTAIRPVVALSRSNLFEGISLNFGGQICTARISSAGVMTFSTGLITLGFFEVFSTNWGATSNKGFPAGWFMWYPLDF